MTNITDIVAAGHSVYSHPIPDGCSQIFAPCLDPHCQRPCGATRETNMPTKFEGCRAGSYDEMTDDEKAYYNDVIKPAIEERRRYRSMRGDELLQDRRRYFIAMALTTIMGLALICAMAALSMPRVERATQEDMQ